ncbi:hypothetical protein PIB30_014693 [Stylosanthes scabra]|uniref:Membrane-associated kinase regulator 2 n=1 Tax=Stylosanthes scabra TaxID=79078 RepID=A0ABU6U5W7_9FABA|nr:hypothetical protein [Stylosanthes scabra]
MEAFSLLKYWRGGGAPLPPPSTAAAATTTLLPQNHNATDSDDDDDDEDADGPFFDLEFAVPDEVDDPQHSHEDLNGAINKHSDQEEGEEDEDDDNIEECEREFKFTLSPSSNDRGDEPNLSLSPSDDLFFKGKLVQVDPSSSSEPNSKPPPPQFTASASLFKSATKFRVFRLGGLNKKSKDSNSAASSDSLPKQTESRQQKKQQQPSERKHFTVKFKVEEVKIMSLFSRDNSSRGNNKKHSHPNNPEESPSSSSEEKRSSKEVMNKYLKMVKPLYIRVSRRYGDKLGFSGHLSLSSASDKPTPPLRDTPEKKGSPSKAAAESEPGENKETSTKSEKQGNNNVQAGLRVVCKRLGKSRSASSAAVAAAPATSVSSKRRDDSLLQQQDGIQGAIMHCKRSFNASRSESECCGVREEVAMAMAMASALEASRKSTNEGKEKSR